MRAEVARPVSRKRPPARALHRFLYMPIPACRLRCKVPVCDLRPVFQLPATTNQLRTMSHNPTFQTRGSQFLEARHHYWGVCGVVGASEQKPTTRAQRPSSPQSYRPSPFPPEEISEW